jgi:hypothetical protein
MIGLAQERVKRRLVVPNREQRPATQVGAEHPRRAATGAEQSPEAQTGRAAQVGAVEAHPRQPAARSRAGSG